MARALRIKDSVVLITGGGKGIGLELVRETRRRGGKPVAVEVDPTRLESLREAVGPEGAAHQADVRDAAAMARIVEETVARYGRLDVVIANAGIERIDPVWSMAPESFEEVIEINVLGVYRTLKPALEPVIRAEGHLLAIASVAALFPMPLGCAYAASKAAVDMMMREIRMELVGTGASAGAAYFGVIRTEMGERVHAHPALGASLKRMPTALIGATPNPTPQRAAIALLDGAERRRARVYAPFMTRFAYAARGLIAQFDGVSVWMMRLGDEIRRHYGPPPGSQR